MTNIAMENGPFIDDQYIYMIIYDIYIINYIIYMYNYIYIF